MYLLHLLTLSQKANSNVVATQAKKDDHTIAYAKVPPTHLLQHCLFRSRLLHLSQASWSRTSCFRNLRCLAFSFYSFSRWKAFPDSTLRIGPGRVA